MAWSTSTVVITTCLLVLVFASPAHAFGAGNIASLSRIEGQNWRHGDIEDTLLTLLTARFMGGKKFSKLDVQRVYFGNWLRDYSQAVDVGTVKYVSAEAIRILLWVLGFMTFGYGTGEFEVTTERLGCYQPTEHIDNPLGYAEGEDARRYDRRLRGPVDERRELAIDPRTGLKCYISSEDQGIDTSAALVRRVLGKCIELGRRHARSGRKPELYEALRLLGTGLHCLEDYAAHSNYTELALIEMGEREVFPHVGRRTQIDLRGARGPVYPITTGTFGGVDFFHSVLGEFSDKATQSELQDLQGVMGDSQNEAPSKSILQDLLDKIPSGIFGGGEDNSGKMNEFQSNAQQAAQHNQNISPRKPEEWTRYLDDVQKQIYPVLEWHDNILQQINEAIEKIPVLPDLIEQIRDQVSIFVFSVIAPYVLPIINQVKGELETGSSEVIQSSKAQQHIVFNNDNCTDPTHSMLSKDHFSNVLNEPAGKVAQAVVKWVVPQIVQCWDDERVDVDRTLNRIIYGVFHHPALRDYGEDGQADIRREMFQVVENWWREQGDRGQNSLRRQLSREGVKNGENHKPGVHDSGHGSCKPMKLPSKKHGGGKSSSSGGFPGAGGQIDSSDIGKFAKEAVGGGTLGNLVGGFVSDALGGGESEEPKKHKQEKHYKEERRYEDDGRYVEEKKYKEKKYKDDSGDDEYRKEKKHKEEKKHKHERKHSGDESYPSYSRIEYQRTEYDDGPPRQTYVQREEYGGGRGYESRTERTGGYGGGYETRTGYEGGYGGSTGGYEARSSAQGGYGGSTGGYETRSGYEGGYGGSTGGYEARTGNQSGYGRSTGGYGSSGYAGDEYGRSGGGYGSSERTYDSGYNRPSGYGPDTQSYGRYGREGSRQEYGAWDQYGSSRRRSRSRGSERESRQYQSGYPERDERRHHSRERRYDIGDEYKKRYDEDSDDDRKKHHHHHHRRRSSRDS